LNVPNKEQEQNCNDHEDDEEELNGPLLPQVASTSREFIKYRSKMVESPVEYELLLNLNEKINTFSGISKIIFNVVNLTVNKYIHVDFQGKINFMMLNDEIVQDEDLYEYMMCFGQGVFFRVPNRFLKEGLNQFVFGFTSWYNTSAMG